LLIFFFNRNNNDGIRQELRDILQRDSKLCQLEQIKEKEMRQKTKKDVDNAWKGVQSQIYLDRKMKEEFVANSRHREGLEIQNFQKEQMANKQEASMKIYDEYNEENKIIAKIHQEDQQAEIDMKRQREKIKKILDADLRVILLN
jgi:CHAT domain-containing protein